MKRYFHLTNPWWSKKKFAYGILRPQYIQDLEQNIDNKIIQILTGLRRVGKSTITLQLINSLIHTHKVNPKKILFFSIEEPSISKIPIVDIINEYRTEFGIKSKSKIYVFIDEIQFRQNWEQEIKSLYDTENIKFILAGSSAMLLSQKLSHLTGRYLKTQVYPLNFTEYLNFKNVKVAKTDEHLLLKHIESYLTNGGMPEYILHQPNRYLETTIESILFKDLVSKFQLRNPKILTDIMYLLADRVGTTSSSLKLSNILEINKDTVLTYINYLNKTYITSELPNYSTSRNKELYNPSKIYFHDTGIGNKYASKNNLGALVENAIFNHLSQQTSNTLRVKFGYYHENKQEIDFILSIKNNTYLIESKWINNFSGINFKPLENALKTHKPKKIIYVTRSLEATKKVYNQPISFIPLHKFLLTNLKYL
jgi:uncharacterized protein